MVGRGLPLETVQGHMVIRVSMNILNSYILLTETRISTSIVIPLDIFVIETKLIKVWSMVQRILVSDLMFMVAPEKIYFIIVKGVFFIFA